MILLPTSLLLVVYLAVMYLLTKYSLPDHLLVGKSDRSIVREHMDTNYHNIKNYKISLRPA